MKLAAFRHKYSLSKTFIVYTTLFIFVVVFLLTLLVTRQYGSTLKRQQEDATIAAFSYSIRQIESMLASSRKSALALTQIAGVRDYLTGAYSTPLEQVELFREVIENILSAQGDSTNGIVFIDENGYASGHLDKWVFFNENNQTLAAVANSISGGVVPSFHIAGSYLQTEFLESIPLEFASYYRNNLSILAVQTYAYPRSQGAKSFSILLSIREEALMELIQPLADDSSLIMLLRKDGHYVAGKGCDFVGRTFSITDELSEDQPSGSRVVTMDGQRYQMIYCRSSNDSWMLQADPLVGVFRRRKSDYRQNRLDQLIDLDSFLHHLFPVDAPDPASVHGNRAKNVRPSGEPSRRAPAHPHPHSRIRHH